MSFHLSFSNHRLSNIWFCFYSTPSEKKQADVLAISFGERQHRCVNKVWLLQSKGSLSKHWLCWALCGWAVIQGHSRSALPRDSKQTVTPALITWVGQTTPIRKINNAGENRSAATLLTTSTQPCLPWRAESIIYMLLLQTPLFYSLSELIFYCLLISAVFFSI